MRRLTLLLAGGAVWLFLAAIPAFADGGPHVAAVNSGSQGINADSCAGCHRPHTAQVSPDISAPLLIQAEPAMCLTCHGGPGAGASTNVVNGVQYTVVGGSAVLGALRGGGFVTAAIGSGTPARYGYLRTPSSTTASFLGKVPVRTDVSGTIAGQGVTSAHLDINATSPAMVTAWGNGSSSLGPGGTMQLECTSCHNPHGNGQYRILQTKPGSVGTGGTFVAPGVDAIVTDVTTGTGRPALPAGGTDYSATLNYTVIQLQPSTTSVLATEVQSYGPTAGNYFNKKVPWNVSGGDLDGPNGLGNSSTTGFNVQMTTWCVQCHTRLFSTGPFNNMSDPIFTYRHTTDSGKPCTICHVVHGSNAQMTGWNSQHVALPNSNGANGTYAPWSSTASTDSFLLKVDNRGTCQLCHDPTKTVKSPTSPGWYVGPIPMPGTP